MTFSFNLVDLPWIPCIRHDGSAVELSLREVLVQAHQLRELGGESPLVTAALYRLLLAVLHRVFGPKNPDAWASLWNHGHGPWDEVALDRYFAQWRHRFDLFDARQPFYQAPDDRVRPVSITTMLPDMSSGNNATLFDHTRDEEIVGLSPAQAARMLIADQNYGLAGLSGIEDKFTDGPCARGVIFLAQGETLFQSLALNLISYPNAHRGGLYLRDLPQDRPAWEMDDPYLPERNQPIGYLDYLTWQNRRILLFPEETPQGVRVCRITRGPGLRLAEGVTDPMKLYFQPKDPKRPLSPLRFSEDRALWRDSVALFQLHAQGKQVPYVMHWLASLVDPIQGILDRAQTVRYLALGMANNQAKVEFFRAERMPLPLDYLVAGGEELVETLASAIQLAENVGRVLEDAGLWLGVLLLKPDLSGESLRDALKDSGLRQTREEANKLARAWGLGRRFWARLEVPFRLLVEALPQETPHERAEKSELGRWVETLRNTAWVAFEEVATNLEGNSRALKAAVKARDQLAMGLGYVTKEQERSQL